VIVVTDAIRVPDFFAPSSEKYGQPIAYLLKLVAPSCKSFVKNRLSGVSLANKLSIRGVSRTAAGHSKFSVPKFAGITISRISQSSE